MSDEFRPADVGREILSNGGVGLITAYTDDQHVTIEITQAFPSVDINSGEWVITGSPQTTVTPSAATPVGAAITLGAAIGAWRPSDVGSYVRINGGLVKITGYTSATQVSGEILEVLNAAVAAVAGSWTLEDSMWGGVYGFPRCGVLFGQRLWQGGSPGFPTYLWGSAIGEYYDYTLGTLDTDAISYNVANGEINPIVNLATCDTLVILTSGGEFSAYGGQEKPITPTNIQIKDQGAYGSKGVPPLRVGKELFMVQRSGKKMRALGVNQYTDSQYEAPDMSVLAAHITEPGIVATAYRAEPDSIVFAVRADGQLATLTADRDQDVFAWTRQVTQGNYESVETVPVEGGWATYVIVSRVIEGVRHRYIERLQVGLHTDSCLLGTSVGGASVWAGLDHLEGMEVDCKADGIYQGVFTVTGGEIDLGERVAFNVEIGLHYNATIKTLTPELSIPANPLAASQLSAHAVKVRLYQSIGCTINLQTVAFREFGLDVLDRPPAPFTGDKTMSAQGWGDGTLSQLIQQNLPYDFHCLAVIQKITAND